MGCLNVEKSPVIIAEANTMPLTVPFLEMKPRLPRPRRNARHVRLMPKVKVVVVELVVAVVDKASSSVRSGEQVVETTKVLEMECNIVGMRGCASVSARAVAGTTLTLLVFTLLGSVIQVPFVCQATMIIGSFLARHTLLLVPRKVEPLVGPLTNPLKVKPVDLPVRNLLSRRSLVVIKERLPTLGSRPFSPILPK